MPLNNTKISYRFDSSFCALCWLFVGIVNFKFLKKTSEFFGNASEIQTQKLWWNVTLVNSDKLDKLLTNLLIKYRITIAQTKTWRFYDWYLVNKSDALRSWWRVAKFNKQKTTNKLVLITSGCLIFAKGAPHIGIKNNFLNIFFRISENPAAMQWFNLKKT